MDYKNREFRIWSYIISHQLLILRSSIYNKNNDSDLILDYNIDIEFDSVSYINLPTTFNLLEIKKVGFELYPHLQKFAENEKLYLLITTDGEYQICANSCTIGKNKWLIESKNSDFNLEYKEKIIL